MLTKLRIQNFKCFQDTGQLDIRPLTFLVGPNSSGKSSILQMLLMLRQTAQSTDYQSPLVTSGPFIELGAFPDFVFRHQLDRQLDVDTQWSPVVTPQGVTFGPTGIRTAFRYDRPTTQIRLAESAFTSGDSYGQSVREAPDGTHRGEMWAVKDGERRVAGPRTITPVLWFVGLSDLADWFPGDAITVPTGWLWHMMRMVHLDPVRRHPKRSYVMPGTVPSDVGSGGERTFEVLWAASQAGNGESTKLLDDVQRWLRNLAIAEGIGLRRLGESSLYEVAVTDPATAAEVNFADIGFGASQVLPIIVQSFCAKPGSTLLVEQPEIHLHPKAQAKLGDLFIEAAQGNDRAFIIETHSEHILSRVCRRIAEKHRGMTKDKVAIYYFSPTSEGTKIEAVTLNENGQYVQYPKGFFEEGFDDALHHAEAMSRNV